MIINQIIFKYNIHVMNLEYINNKFDLYHKYF